MFTYVTLFTPLPSPIHIISKHISESIVYMLSPQWHIFSSNKPRERITRASNRHIEAHSNVERQPGERVVDCYSVHVYCIINELYEAAINAR